MAKSLNKVILIGRLGKNPEIRYSSDGKGVANFSIATDETYKDKNNNLQTITEWVKIVAFGKLAEICGEYLTKGKLVYVEGKLRTRSWTDQNGEKKYTTEVLANNMIMLDGKNEASSHPSSEFQEPQNSVDDEIPF